MDFVLGSELEVSISADRFRSRQYLHAMLVNSGFHVNTGMERDKYARWSVHSDLSIHPSRRQFGIELVSPCLSVGEYFSESNKMLAYLGEDISTNGSTGYHHGVSLASPALNKKLQCRQSLLAWLWWKNGYDASELARWGRVNNTYCMPVADIFNTDGARAGYYTGWDIAHRPYRFGKYRAINFTKLDSTNKYIEVRLMGGPNYHKRTADVLTTLSRIMETIDQTLNNHRYGEMMDYLKVGYGMNGEEVIEFERFHNGESL